MSHVEMPIRRSRSRTTSRTLSTKKRKYGAIRGTMVARRSKYARKRVYRRRVSYRKKRSGFSSFVVDPRSKLFPERKYATLVYQNVGFILAPGAAKLAAHHLWQAANMRDPNYTGSGHQPHFYDQMMQLYTYYTVLESRIEVVFSAGSGSDTGAYQLGVAIRPDNVPESSAQHYSESGGCKSGLYTYIQGPRTYSLTYYPGKTLGFNDSPLNHQELRGNDSIDPSRAPMFHVFANAIDTAGAPGNIHCVVKLQYKACFTHPKYVGPSAADLEEDSEHPVVVGHDAHMEPTGLLSKMGLA